MATTNELWELAWHWLVSYPDLESVDPNNPALFHAEFDTWKAEVLANGPGDILSLINAADPDHIDRLKNALRGRTRLIEAVDEWVLSVT